MIAMDNKRIFNLRHIMNEWTLPAVLITDPANVFYFSGFAGTPGDGILLITQEEEYIMTDSRYTLQAIAQCPGFTVLGSSASDVHSLRDKLSFLGIKRVGFENMSISYYLWHRLVEEMGDVSLVPVNKTVSSMRFVKDGEECGLIAAACEIACTALQEAVPYIVPGITEREIALELEYRMRKNGASGTSFDTIVASGERSALPHGIASDRRIQVGDAVTVDFGAVYAGYCSDMTRTFFVGEPSPELRKIYEAVLRAQQAAIHGFYVGIPACELDGIARSVLAEEGYGKYFTHALGHGVGVEIHEGLSVSRKENGSITEGMVFSIEPGVYIEGVGGVRIEDLVVCEKDGLRILTEGFKKELAIL